MDHEKKLCLIGQSYLRIIRIDIFEKLKEKQVYITIAHPFDGGNPFCTGCRWEYILENLKFVDAIEVWNSTNPHQSLSNEDAFYKWTQLLKQGYEIAASSGRDWHQTLSRRSNCLYLDTSTRK